MIAHTNPNDALHDEPPSADEAVAKLRLQLRQLSLEELEQEGVVRWDRDEHVVRKGPQFDAKRPEWGIDY